MLTPTGLAVLASRAAELGRPVPGVEFGPMRPGQAAWHALYEVDEALAERIKGTASDPYSDDALLPEFWAAVTEAALEPEWRDEQETA